jgi:hypothetical protein
MLDVGRVKLGPLSLFMLKYFPIHTKCNNGLEFITKDGKGVQVGIFKYGNVTQIINVMIKSSSRVTSKGSSRVTSKGLCITL